MKPFVFSACISTIVSATVSAHAAETTRPHALSETDTILLQERRDALLAPIKSHAELRSYLARTRDRDNPLNLLSGKGRSEFLASLVFTENGLGGFNKKALESELTATQIYKILSLFGVQRTASMLKGAKVLDATDEAIMNVPSLMPDHDNYRCSSRATCSQSAHDICTSNC